MSLPTPKSIRARVWFTGILVSAWTASSVATAAAAASPEPFQELQRQNQELRDMLRRQQQVIDNLEKRLSELENAAVRAPVAEPPGLPSPPPSRSRSGSPSVLPAWPEDQLPEIELPAAPPTRGFSLGNLIVGGQAAVGFFHTGSEGWSPNGEFRVDEAKLFFDAKILEDVYFFAEVNLITRETGDDFLHLGELYLDWEGIGAGWGWKNALNLRVGRLDIPFGEEYLRRDAIDNILISHSVADIWGIDEGIELYGAIGGVRYAVAVQNGDHDIFRDHTTDKSVAGRIGYDAAPWLHLSISGMRTGDLDATVDSRDPTARFSEIWFSNGFFGSIGPRAATTRFHADLVEGDVIVRWKGGELAGSGGYVRYDDNSRDFNTGRDMIHYSAEVSQRVSGGFYVASRFSQVLVDGGYPLPGLSTFRIYGSPILTKDLWRLGLGAGYRWSENLLLKLEYSFERGRTTTGASRDHEDMIAAEVVGRF